MSYNESNGIHPIAGRKLRVTIHRRAVLTGLAGGLLLSQTEARGQEANYPSRTVKMTVGTGAGGAADTTARVAAKVLSDSLGQTFVVENRPGAQGLVSLSAFVKERTDGYSLFMLASSQAVLPALYQLPYDPVNDITPIARLTVASVILVVNPDLPVKSVKDLVDYAKKNPDKITYGYQGGPIQIACALFAKLAGFQPVAVPFTASAQVATEMLAGRLTYTVMTGEQAKPLVDAGKLRALATAGTKRALAFPDIPTLAELGYPAYGDGWFGLIGPKNLPKPIVDKLYTVFKDHYYDKDPQHLLVARGMEPAYEGPEAFTAFLKADIARWIAAGEQLGIAKVKP
jgi:tripartite-type tricarboxylate transporter receptor subunit TctC